MTDDGFHRNCNNGNDSWFCICNACKLHQRILVVVVAVSPVVVVTGTHMVVEIIVGSVVGADPLVAYVAVV